MTTYNLQINGVRQSVDADPQMPLLWVLRDLLEMTGTKFGCGIGQCGCCTVLLEGVAVRSCQMPVGSIGTLAITTIEGIAAESDNAVTAAWREENTSQCGYCQSGQIMSAVSLLRSNNNPSDKDIDAIMTGNLCRCGTYKRIRKSIHTAARKMRGET